MSQWNDLFETKVSAEYKNKVLSQADSILAGLAQPATPWYLRWQFASTMAGIVAVFAYFARLSQESPFQELDLTLTDDQELLEDLDLFEDLELIELLNVETGEFES